MGEIMYILAIIFGYSFIGAFIGVGLYRLLDYLYDKEYIGGDCDLYGGYGLAVGVLLDFVLLKLIRDWILSHCGFVITAGISKVMC